MEKKCYIPSELESLYLDNTVKIDKYQNHLDEIDSRAASRLIMGTYYHFCCVPNDDNEHQVYDQSGLGIFEKICLSLLTIPKFTHHIRMVMTNLDNVINCIKEGRVQLEDAMVITFTLEELIMYG
jgi:hypothetical protein